MRGATTSTTTRTLAGLGSAALALGVVVGGIALSQSDARAERPTASLAEQSGAAQPGLNADFLVKGLESVEGCLGTELAQTQSGKACIIAWFEDKAAAERWYYHQTHQMMMGMVGADRNRKPMQHIADDSGPIMVIATITPSEEKGIEGFPMPISQISIELFAPLPGGAHINGRLSPKEFKVPHMKDYTTDGAAAEGAAEPGR